MRIEFGYTLADLEEALVPETFAGNPRAYRRRPIKGLVGWSLFTAFVLYSLWPHSWIGSRHRQSLVPQDLESTMGPNYLAASILFVALVILMVSNWQRSRRRVDKTQYPTKKPSQLRRIVLITLVTGAICGPLAVFSSGWSSVWHATPSELLLANTIPWAIDLLLFALFAVLQARWRVRQIWFSNPAWERSQTIELDESGVRTSDGMTEVHFAWGYFPRAWETPNLLVMLCENAGRVVIPKRAIAGVSHVEQVRAMLQNGIANTNFLVNPAGFPIAPRPAIPLEHPTDASASKAESAGEERRREAD